MYVYKEEYNESVYLYFLTLKKNIIYHVLEDFLLKIIGNKCQWGSQLFFSVFKGKK